MRRRLIRYAGWDPEEHSFDVNGTTLNVERIRELRAQKLSYRAIGEILAEEEGRKIRYCGETISSALYRSDRADQIQRERDHEEGDEEECSSEEGCGQEVSSGQEDPS